MTMTPPHETIVHSDSDLYDLWHGLMGSGGYAQRSLWLLFFGADGRPEPVIVPIDDIPSRPDARLIGALGEIVAGLITQDTTEDSQVASVAMLLSRPGPHQMTADDRVWARALVPVTPKWPVHLATTDRLQVFAPDDLLSG
jgi:hypothetical protein